VKNRRELLRAAAYVIAAAGAIIVIIFITDCFAPAELQVDLNRPRFRLVRHRTILPDQAFELDWTRIRSWEFPPDEGPATFGQRMSGGRYSWEVIEPLGGMRFEEVLDYPSDYVVYQMHTRSMFKPSFPLRQAEAWATNH